MAYNHRKVLLGEVAVEDTFQVTMGKVPGTKYFGRYAGVLVSKHKRALGYHYLDLSRVHWTVYLSIR